MELLQNENLKRAIPLRHSVRRFTDRLPDEEQIRILREAIAQINAESGLRIGLAIDEPEAFRAGKPSYGSFSGCRNYLIMAGKKGDDEKIGYYGEKLVLLAQNIGLNTCWVALTFERNKVRAGIGEGEKLFDLIALGEGITQGTPHKSKPLEKLAALNEQSPAWFRAGVEAAALAPTAINQQRFFIEQTGERTVRAKAFFGPCSKTDLGIVKCHFEIGAGAENFDFEQ